MSFFNKVKTAISGAAQNVSTEIAKHKNKTFLDGAMGVCAWIAAADGDISSEEKQKTIGFASQSEALKVFDQNLVIERFTYFADKFQFDASIGKGEALKAIEQAVAKDPSSARLLVLVGISIGKSDGDFDADEKKVLVELCSALNLNPSEFDI